MVATSSQWRQFNFFDSDVVGHNAERSDEIPLLDSLQTSPPHIIISPDTASPLACEIACIVCDARGTICVLDKSFNETKRWQGWDVDGTSVSMEDTSGYNLGLGLTSKTKRKHKEKGLMMLECGGLLIAIGEDDSPTQSQFPLLRIWDLTKDDSRDRQPLLLRSVRIGTGGRGYPISSIALSPALSYLAIGLVSGQVLLYRHLLQSLQTSPTAQSSFPKARVVWEGTAAEPITGLGFKLSGQMESYDAPMRNMAGDLRQDKTPGSDSVGLFIVTTNKTLALPVISGKGSEPRLLEESGAPLSCSVMDHTHRCLVIAREDGIYIYDTEARGACYAYEGAKASVRIHGQSLVMVSPPFIPAASSQSATVRRSAAARPAVLRSQAAKVTVFDLENKFISYSSVIASGVRELFGNDGQVFYILEGDGKVQKLTEASVEEKLEALLRKSLFQMAVSMAKSARQGDSVISDIHLRYGDYLYEKGDYDGAVAQYQKTLGWVQPSHVIRKFLEAHRIHQLTSYLQEMHVRNLATPDHTTLLLNCYAKTADKERLDAFIRTETTRKGSDDLPFDLTTAIRVCRQAGFHEHALYLAKRYNRYQDYLRIQLDDLDDFAAVAAFLHTLPLELVAEIIVPYVKDMLRRHPQATTDLLIEICTSWKMERSGSEATPKRQVPASRDLQPHQFSHDESASSPEALGASQDLVHQPVRPSPELFFPDFVNEPEQFRRFLETVALRNWSQRIEDEEVPRRHSRLHKPPITLDATTATEGEESSQRAVWNTLLELYLGKSRPDRQQEGDRNDHDRALALLEQIDRLPLDPVHALMLCSAFDFEAGLMCLWERLGMYEEIMRFWRQRMDVETEGTASASVETPAARMLYYLRIYGPTQPHLYPMVLRYITTFPSTLARHTADVRDILDTIQQERIMPPLAVIQLLSRNDVTNIGVVKDWLKSQVADTRLDIDSDTQLVHSYRSETEEKLREIASLTDVTRPQVFQVTRCASCNGQLDLPSVHFMCKHSYHQRCLPDADPECPACARHHALIREIRRNQEASIDRHDLFLVEVSESLDPFSVVAGAFGRGGMLNRKSEGIL